jgi:hypothetical protein
MRSLYKKSGKWYAEGVKKSGLIYGAAMNHKHKTHSNFPGSAAGAAFFAPSISIPIQTRTATPKIVFFSDHCAIGLLIEPGFWSIVTPCYSNILFWYVREYFRDHTPSDAGI